MADFCPSRSLNRKELFRKELVAGKRADNRKLLEFQETVLSELKCSNPEDILIIARIGTTRVSCSLSLDIREAEPEPDLIHLRVSTLDDTQPRSALGQEEGDSDDEIEMDDQEDHSSKNLEREATLESLMEEFDLIDESRLVLLPGRLVLHLNIAITVLQNNGNIIDSSFFALIAALERLRLPKVQYDSTEDSLQYSWDELHSAGVLLRHRRTCATFAVIGSLVICGPSAEEEENSDALILTAGGSSSTFLEVIDGLLPPDFTGVPLDQIRETADSRRANLNFILDNSPSDDLLIPNAKTVRVRDDS